MHKMIVVREFPPKEDLKIFVNGEFLYGICRWLLFLLLSEITYVKKKRLLFMHFPSLTLVSIRYAL